MLLLNRRGGCTWRSALSIACDALHRASSPDAVALESVVESTVALAVVCPLAVGNLT